MLEDCADLPACEIILSEATKSVRLLGEIELSAEDIDLLARLVCQKISTSISRGTAYLRTKTKISFVCFLVGMGRFYDKQIGYWPVVEMKVGQIDINWKVKWGKIFNQFLVDNNLPRFAEEEGLTYVTPILSHACIPDCCLDEYFDRVVTPLIQRDLLNPLDQQEIIHDLRVKRKINAVRLELEKKKKEHDELLEVLHREYRDQKKRRDKYEGIASTLTKEDECNRRKIAFMGLEDAELTRLNLVTCITELTKSIRRLESEGNKLWGILTEFRQKFQPVIEVKSRIDTLIRNYERLDKELPEALVTEKMHYSDVITEWAKQSREPWNESFGVELLQLSLEQLLSQIDQYTNLQEKHKVTQEKIGNLEASKNEAKKPPPLVLSLLVFIRKTLIWIRRKNAAPQPSELQQLQATYREAKVQLQLQRDTIKGLFARLPVEEKLLDNPTHDLYEGLCTLKIMYINFIEAQHNRIKLEEEIEQLTEQGRNLAPSLDISIDENISTLVNRFSEVLKEAQQNQVGALEAKRILEKEIRPALEEVQLEYKDLKVKLSELDQQLAELGDGSTQQGLNLVQEFHRDQAEVEQTRQNLSSQFSDLIIMENELRIHGWDTIERGFNEDLAKAEDLIQAAKSEFEQLRRGFDSYPAQYINIDEPIRSFLLYGELTAENYLCDCVYLFARAKSGERVEDISVLHLPNRIIQHFQQWWESYRTRIELKSTLEEEANLATGERFRAPQIYFAAATGEIITKLPSQRFLRSDHGTTVQFDVFSADFSTPIYAAPLKLYNRTRGLVDTHSCNDIVLTTPSEKYIFRLKSKDNLIHEWELLGPCDRTPLLAFSSRSNKLIKGETLPRSPLILVINKKLSIHPQECILTEGGFLFGEWKEYVWYEVDLSTIEEFCLSSYDGQSLTVPLTSEPVSNIVLSGGNQLSGILSDERPIFDLPPEYIRIPINNQDELHLLRLSLFWEDENQTRKSKHYQVDELVNLINVHNEGWIDIPLNVEELLGTNPIGCFTLRVYRPPYVDWQQSFCIFPQLTASFDQEMYLPYRETIPNIIVTLYSSRNEHI